MTPKERRFLESYTSMPTTTGVRSLWNWPPDNSVTTASSLTWDNWNRVSTTNGSAVWRTWCTYPSRQAVHTAYGAIHNAINDLPRERAVARPQVMTTAMRHEYALQEQRAIEEQRRRQEIQQAADAARKAASDKALALLLSAITPEQRADLLGKGYFFVRSQRGNLYRIDNGSYRNVRLVDPTTKVVLRTYCIYATDDCPAGDNMLAQKLLLETMEDYFLATANKWDHAPPVIGTVRPDDLVRVAGIGPLAAPEPAAAQA